MTIKPENREVVGGAASVRDEEIEAFMRSLVCDQFQIDPHSRFCNECGYSRSDHRRKSATTETDVTGG